VWAQRLSEKSIQELPRSRESALPLDLRIDVLDKECEFLRGKEDCGPRPYLPWIFIVRRSADHWTVIDWEYADWRLLGIDPFGTYVYRGRKRK
jgi:hypothetical protein